jgi:uncharacterized membrane protein
MVFYALINVYDKYVVEHRAKKPLSYAVIDGFMILLFASVIALFLDWSAVPMNAVIFPVIMGILSGISTWFYYFIIIKQDISHVVGIIYTFPIVVSIFSFLFLGEVIPFIGYLGMLISVTGIIILSTRLKKVRLSMLFYLVFLVLMIAAIEILAKVATSNMPVMNGVIIMLGLTGFIMGCGCFVRKLR